MTKCTTLRNLQLTKTLLFALLFTFKTNFMGRDLKLTFKFLFNSREFPVEYSLEKYPDSVKVFDKGSDLA